MNSRLPPRYLPTLTEVVHPNALDVATPFPAAHAEPVNRHVLAQQIIQQVRPQLEAELRNIAQELFEAQFSALLPSLHLQIEEAVREALEQALPDRSAFRE